LAGGARLSTIDDALRPYGYYAIRNRPYFSARLQVWLPAFAALGFSKNVASMGCNWTQIMGVKVVLPNGDVIPPVQVLTPTSTGIPSSSVK
jgi:hypothetical protein